MIKEVEDNSTNSPRLKNLSECLDKWIDSFNHDIKGEGIDLFLVAYDNKYKHAIKCALTSTDEPIHNIFTALNKGIGNLNNNLSKDMLNELCSYLCNVLACYPELEKIFMDNLNIMKGNNKQLTLWMDKLNS